MWESAALPIGLEREEKKERERERGGNMGLKRGAGHRCHGSRWRLWRPRRQILLSWKPHQHSCLRWSYYQRGRGGRKAEGLSVCCVLAASLIPENLCKPENPRAAWQQAAFYIERTWKRVKAGGGFLVQFLSSIYLHEM